MNGKQYSNECFAKLNGTTVDCVGECPCDLSDSNPNAEVVTDGHQRSNTSTKVTATPKTTTTTTIEPTSTTTTKPTTSTKTTTTKIITTTSTTPTTTTTTTTTT